MELRYKLEKKRNYMYFLDRTIEFIVWIWPYRRTLRRVHDGYPVVERASWVRTTNSPIFQGTGSILESRAHLASFSPCDFVVDGEMDGCRFWRAQQLVEDGRRRRRLPTNPGSEIANKARREWLSHQKIQGNGSCRGKCPGFYFPVTYRNRRFWSFSKMSSEWVVDQIGWNRRVTWRS